MSKHTPGPWDTDVQEHDEPYMNITIRAKHRRKICSIDIDDAPVQDYNAEQRANARLIAAAPDMFEAIEETLQSAIKNRMHDSIEITSDAVEMLRAAIAKAKGGA